MNTLALRRAAVAPFAAQSLSRSIHVQAGNRTTGVLLFKQGRPARHTIPSISAIKSYATSPTPAPTPSPTQGGHAFIRGGEGYPSTSHTYILY